MGMSFLFFQGLGCGFGHAMPAPQVNAKANPSFYAPTFI
jgi:hypothetical protein